MLRQKVEGVAQDLKMKQARRHLMLRLVAMLRLVLPRAESQLSRPQAQVQAQVQVLLQARASQQAQQESQQAQQHSQKIQLSEVGSALQQAR